MKAIRIHFTGSGDELRMEEVPQPDPKAGEVLIETQAIGVNRADLGRRKNRIRRRAGAAKNSWP